MAFLAPLLGMGPKPILSSDAKKCQHCCSLEHSIGEESATYWNHTRSRAEQEAETLRRLKEMENRFNARIDANVEA
jgi:hypothetical protein